MFDRPTVGKVVTVTIDWTDYVATSTPTTRIVYGKQTITGKVMENFPFNDPASFNMTTGNPKLPVGNVALHRVEALSYADGADAATVESFDADSDEWLVPGSNGVMYTVSRVGNKWDCECKGYMFRNQCKHVNEKKTEYMEKMK